MKALAPNTLIQNRYLIVQLIGKGGMGEVYLAVDQRLGSAVALKRTFFADDEMLGNAFEREAKILARLRHPVLPKVSDHFAESGEQYLVMEHIAGDDLSKRLEASQKAFPLSWVLFWADQLLDALSYLHSHEPPIIHRDIKPQNLKLTDENHIVLLDFGLSKNSTGQTNITSTSGSSSGSVVGYTPHYAPMEQIRGTGTSPRSDIYALSATLYQLMTNAVPADALTRADALLNEMDDPIKHLYVIDPEIPPTVSEVILRGMEVSQEKRWPNARDMQKALRKAFTQMQEAMSASTVAFNAQSGFPSLAEKHASMAPPTDVMNDLPRVDSEVPTKAPSKPGSGQPSAFAANDQTNGQNFDDTIQIDGGTADAGIKQSDLKTEVFLAGSTPLADSIQSDESFAQTPSGNDTPFSTNDNFTSPENFADTTNFQGGETGYAPDATTPIISFDQEAGSPVDEPGTADFYTTPGIGQEPDPFSTYTPAQYSQADSGVQEEQVPQHAVSPAVQPAKKGSKVFLVVGGLVALLVLASVAAVGGWVVYSNYYAAGVVEPTPSPEPSVEPTPSPEPSQETIFGSNSVDNTNLDSNTNSDEDLTVEPTPEPTQQQPERQPEIDTPPGTPRPTPQVKRTPRTSPTPGTKRTPTPRTPGNRTIILP